jgi:glycyl-tRNA synthetase
VLPGKNEESARKVARQFYASRGMKDPILVGESISEVIGTTSYNPENGAQLTPPRQFNLMFKTTVGPVEDDENIAYLRPETAQAIFAQFRNVLDTSRMKLPFGIAQIGKAFRNEINPRNFTFRSREFEQMELEYFIRPDEIVLKTEGRVDEQGGGEPRADWGWQAWHRYWLAERRRWYGTVGIAQEDLQEYWQSREELAHYARATVDLLFRFPFGTQELEGIAARGDFDLTQHQNHSGKPLDYFDEFAKQRYVPHVIEPSAGVDRLVLALICSAYDEEKSAGDEDSKEELRTVMRFHPRVAPYKCAVFPLLKNKPELVEKARQIFRVLKQQFMCFYDENGAIGRRYRRQDEIGTPLCITVDFETLEGCREGGKKDTVTVRDRDTMRQDRIAIDELSNYISEKLNQPPQRSSLR